MPAVLRSATRSMTMPRSVPPASGQAPVSRPCRAGTATPEPSRAPSTSASRLVPGSILRKSLNKATESHVIVVVGLLAGPDASSERAP